MFIAFEGLDGSGKSTLARRTAEVIGAHTMTTPSPGIREYRETLIEALGPSQEARQLFYLATVFAASREIAELRSRGRSIVLDRYFLSTVAYAQFRGSQLEIDALAGLLVPADLTVYLDATLDVRRRRVGERGASVADHETLTSDADLRLRDLHLARRNLAVVGEFVIVDTSRQSTERCLEAVLQAIASHT
ncbi:dTMP kinase [Nannocystaceae bacterium ST9]